MAAILVACTAIFLLSAMDAAMKSLVLGVGLYNALFWRSVLASAAFGAAWTARRPSLPSRGVLRIHGLRTLTIALVLICFFWGLARLPLAEAIALSFIAPLIALYLAAALLGETVRRSAVWASLACLVGVGIIVAGQFGKADYTPEAVRGTAAVLASAVFYAYNLVLARRQAQVARPLEIAFFQNLMLVAIFGLAAPWLVRSLPAEHWLLIAGVTALSMTGQFLFSWAYARAEAQYLIPMEYTAFVWAILLGWLVFGETVGWTTVAGAGLIIAGCLYAARSNRRNAAPVETAA